MRYPELRALAVFSCIAHLMLAQGLWANLGAVGSSPASRVMDQLFPQWVWPAAFGVVGVSAGLTVAGRSRWLRLSFYVGSGLMLIWGLATFAAWWQNPEQPQPSAAWLVYIAAVKFVLARFVLDRQRLALLATRVVALGEEVIRESGREPTTEDGAGE